MVLYLNSQLETAITYQIPDKDYRYVLDYMFKGCLYGRYDHITTVAEAYSYIDGVECSLINCLEAGVPQFYNCINRKRVELDMLWQRLFVIKSRLDN